MIELAQGTLFHEHGKVHVGFGAREVIRSDKNGVAS
jgi:hypothetical protein